MGEMKFEQATFLWQDACSRDSMQAGAHKVDCVMKISEITEGTWQQASVACFHWSMSTL